MLPVLSGTKERSKTRGARATRRTEYDSINPHYLRGCSIIRYQQLSLSCTLIKIVVEEGANVNWIR